MIKIVFLGTTSGVPTRDRNLPSVFLMYENERILFDCGEGTQRQLMSKNLKFMKLHRIFISHWHADHFAGLLGLIQTMALENRKEPLYIYGPNRTQEFVDKLLSVGYFVRTFEIVARDLNEGDVIKGPDFQVIPFKVKHRIPALGYVFQENERIKANMQKAKKFGLSTGPLIGKLKAGQTIDFNGQTIKPDDIIERAPGKKIVYSGDTTPQDNTVKFSQGADLLIHDCTFADDFEERAGDFRHSTPSKVADIAKRAGVKQLVLTHISRRYQMDSKVNVLEKEARSIFPNSKIAEDFMEIKIK